MGKVVWHDHEELSLGPQDLCVAACTHKLSAGMGVNEIGRGHGLIGNQVSVQ